jgi:hypothetical protein
MEFPAVGARPASAASPCTTPRCPNSLIIQALHSLCARRRVRPVCGRPILCGRHQRVRQLHRHHHLRFGRRRFVHSMRLSAPPRLARVRGLTELAGCRGVREWGAHQLRAMSVAAAQPAAAQHTAAQPAAPDHPPALLRSRKRHQAGWRSSDGQPRQPGRDYHLVSPPTMGLCCHCRRTSCCSATTLSSPLPPRSVGFAIDSLGNM